ncbi:hypothetical protein [Kitasatospora sp. CB02891]|uniref:DUF6907 domain-containing protein n=1 Tax=Kitasatospora sp. CB02891 TaxID=2020329 RepID=UPI000C27FC10|nr:hypothetical protein [Kitasatospora sp. CB02891]PJN22396.1 hypothetical protein CG736_28195 [Kitasatospora sp. CB02891]
MYTSAPESDGSTPITELIAAIRDGQSPLAPSRRPAGGHIVSVDLSVLDRAQVNDILHALGIPPARPIEAVYADAVTATKTLADAEIAASPGCATVNAEVWGDAVITILEPTWCTTSHTQHNGMGDHPQDLYHASDEQFVCVTRANGTPEDLFSGWIASSPFLAEATDRPPCGMIGFANGDCEEYDEAGLDRLAHELRAAAAMIDGLRAQLRRATSGHQMTAA